MTPSYTDSARQALRIASDMAYELADGNIGTEHILIGLAGCEGAASEVLLKNGVSSEKLIEITQNLIETRSNTSVMGNDEYTPKAAAVVEASAKEAKRLSSKVVGTEHILIALLRENDCVAVRLLNTIGINVQRLYIDCMLALGFDMAAAKNDYMAYRSSNKNNKGKSTTPVLDQYSRDLTAYAAAGKLDPVIGRERELHNLIRILSRRTKNNPCLIGEPGVGKTAIVEALATRIAAGDVPETVRDKRVLTLDLSGMVAGSKYRGEFEERIKRAIKEVTSDGNILLFLDEIHTIIGAGGAEGAIDASNILKPSLARGEVQLIGATTITEYRKYIEKDAALERRFQPVMVEEPTEAESIRILMGLKSRYEEHHHVVITDAAVDAAVNMTKRYINDRFLPDKAIDVMDEAASRVRLGILTSCPEIREIEDKNRELEQEKEEALRNELYDKASGIKEEQEANRNKIMQLRRELHANNETSGSVSVGEEEIAAIISSWTKIPVSRLQQTETEKLLNLENILHKRVVGQDEAVESIARAVRRGRVGLRNPNRPIGTFMFLGPTGVGKTELSKALAEAVFGKESAIIRVDMSEYMEKHSVAKMIGSPPGYVGYEEGGQLSERVRRNPYSVILFDEIEKAHPDVFNILLQVLEDGHITDSQGRRVSFRETIIIMTSNAGAQRILAPKLLGFSSTHDEQEDYKKMKAGVMEEVKRLFKPEFINRIDEIIVFHSLTRDNIKDIARIMFSSLIRRASEQMDITLEPTEQLYEHIAESGFDKDYGARPIRRAIQTDVEDALADGILSGNIRSHTTVVLDWEDGRLSCKVE